MEINVRGKKTGLFSNLMKRNSKKCFFLFGFFLTFIPPSNILKCLKNQTNLDVT